MKEGLYLLLFIILVSCDQTYDLFLLSETAPQLSENSEVRIQGLKVGETKESELTDDLQVVTLIQVDNSVRLPIDAEFSIQTIDVFGKSVISVERGKSNQYLNAGDTVYLNVYNRIEQDTTLTNTVLEMMNDLLGRGNRDSIFKELQRINKRLDALEQ